MIKRIFRRNTRQPLATLAVILFAAVLTVVLCYLHKSGQEEQRSFEETYVSVPVIFRVTALDGTKTESIPGWIADLFTDRGMKPNLAPHVGELYARIHNSAEYPYTATDSNGATIETTLEIGVAGISSLYVAEELTENYGGVIHWKNGYDESILSTEELVCLVPESMKEEETMELTFTYKGTAPNGQPFSKTTTRTLQVVGYYIDKGNSMLYCPYTVMTQIFAELGKSKTISQICAKLNDNYALDQLYEDAALWFAKPNPTGEKTEWGQFGFDYYFYALDVDDFMLKNLEMNMKNSMRLNALASMVVFILSAGAGFLTGFLVIRARKREIALMRTMGGSQVAIYGELALEQLACIAVGILLGGSYTLWQPIGRLALFGGVYYVGLTVALLIFLRKNLLTIIKEDE